MRNLWNHIEDITGDGIDDFGLMWYLGALLVTGMTIDAILTLIPFMLPLFMSSGGDFFMELVTLIAGFFLIYWISPRIPDTHVLGIIMIVELVISFVILRLATFEDAFDLACIMSIISLIYWLVDRESI